MSPTSSSTTLSRRALIRAGTGVFAVAALGVSPDVGRLLRSPTDASSDLGVPLGLPATTRFRAVAPTRLVDTRSGGRWRRIDPRRLRVPIVGHAGVPSTAVAAAVTVTAQGRLDHGVASVGPASAAHDEDPHASLLDLGPARDHSQMCFVRLGDEGSIDVFHHPTSVAMTVDIVGYFEPARSSSAGRVVTIEPTRVFDTTLSADPFRPWEIRDVATNGACPPDALAVLINLTASSPERDGHWAALPDGTSSPITTLVSSAMPRAAFALVPLTNGSFRLRSGGGGHASVDVVGHITGDGASDSTDGLFVPEVPYRALDTRLVGQPVPMGSSREFSVGPSSCSAVAMSVATVSADTDGQAMVWGAGARRPVGPTIHFGADGGVASNFAVTRTGRRGAAIGAVGGAAHAIVDVYGWFTGERADGLESVHGAQPYGIQGIEMEAYADEWFDYGLSTDGRPLRAFRHGSGPRHGLLTTGLHGDEHTGTSVLADLVTRSPIPGWTLWLVPIVNPDARSANTRYVHDVDMNRDFPVDWSLRPTATGTGCVTTRTGPEPLTLSESRQMAAAMVSGPFSRSILSISHHDNYNWVAPQAGSPAALRLLADDYADATGLRRPGEGGSVVPTSPGHTKVGGGFETFAHSLGMSSILVENKAGYVGNSMCAGAFGLDPAAADVAPHHDALYSLLTNARMP